MKYRNTAIYNSQKLGLKGWCLEIELRPSSPHSQNGFVPFLELSLAKARLVAGKNKKLLVRATKCTIDRKG